MSWRGFTAALLGAALCVGFGAKAFTEDQPAGKVPESDPKAAEMQKKMEELAKPGPMHEWLGMAAGTWKVTGSCLCEGGKRSEASGTATIRMTLGGRWQEHVFSGSLENRPFVGYGLTGYDNGKQEFTQIWLDNFSTGATVASGKLSDDKKTLSFSGTMEMGDVKMPFTSTLTVENENRAVYAMNGNMDGKDVPMMELTYERTGRGSGVQAGGGAGGQQQGGQPQQGMQPAGGGSYRSGNPCR
jgi:hypothetical protein